jgi:hypothetical protein
MAFKVPEKFRIKTGRLASNEAFGNNGAFSVTLKNAQKVFAIASDQMGWEHVSVSRTDRCLTWEEMCQVKDMFWGDDESVMQIHPPKSEYINNHQFCLHLWRPVDQVIPMPPSIMVGVKG